VAALNPPRPKDFRVRRSWEVNVEPVFAFLVEMPYHDPHGSKNARRFPKMPWKSHDFYGTANRKIFENGWKSHARDPPLGGLGGSDPSRQKHAMRIKTKMNKNSPIRAYQYRLRKCHAT